MAMTAPLPLTHIAHRMTRAAPLLAVLAVLAVLAGACTGHEPAPMVFAEDCQSCHLIEFQEALDPVHVDVYPARCVACHNNITWTPDDNSGHERIFPVAGTEHDGLTCEECHPAPANTLDFTCTECHEHERADMADEHDGVGDYEYLSRRCLDCHPEGG